VSSTPLLHHFLLIGAQVIIVPLNHITCGPIFPRKYYLYPYIQTLTPLTHTFYHFSSETSLSPQTLNPNFTFLPPKLIYTMFIVSFYTEKFIQNGLHGVYYSKKATDNFTVHADITLTKLETELYRWMGILSSTHGLEISARFNVEL
jgi:hypothetical protein